MTFNPDTSTASNDWVDSNTTTSTLTSVSVPSSSMIGSSGVSSTMTLNPIPSTNVVPQGSLPDNGFGVSTGNEYSPLVLIYNSLFDVVEDKFHESNKYFTDTFNIETVLWSNNGNMENLWQVR